MLNCRDPFYSIFAVATRWLFALATNEILIANNFTGRTQKILPFAYQRYLPNQASCVHHDGIPGVASRRAFIDTRAL